MSAARPPTEDTAGSASSSLTRSHAAHRTPLLPLDRSIELTDLIFHESILFVRFTVTNCGVLPWKNLALADGERFQTVIRLFPPSHVAPAPVSQAPFPLAYNPHDRGAQSEPLEEHVRFDRAELNPGESGTVTAWFDLAGMLNGMYRLELDVVRGATPFAALGIPPFVREIERVGSRPLPEIPIGDLLPAELAHVNIHHLELLPFGVISLRGQARNSGTAPWSERTDREAPILMGARLICKSSEGIRCIEEQRMHLHRDPLLPGEQLSFSFSFSLREQPPGAYVVEAGVVKEWNYWIACDSSSVTTRTIEWRGPVAPATLERKIPLGRLKARGAPCRVLVISPSLPLYDRQYGGRRLFDILLSLRRSGHAVTFIYEQRGRYGEEARLYIRALEEHGIIVGSQPVIRITEERNSPGYDVALLTWHETAHRYLNLLRTLLPKTRIIVDSVDIHWVREQRASDAGLSDATVEELTQRRSEELESYRAADIVWTVSEPDRTAIANELPAKAIQVVPSFFAPIESPSPLGRTITLLYLGSFRHPPNESAARWSIEILREARTKLGTDIQLRIVGEQPPQSILAESDGDAVQVLGHVPDLADVFRGVDLLVSPTVYGSGIRGKIIDALSYGIPAVTTPIGIEGLPLLPWEHYLPASTTGEFIEILKNLRNGEYDLEQMVRSASAALISSMGPRVMDPVIDAAIRCAPVVICVVTYNRREMLEKCLRSILEKTRYPDFRIAVWSNGCTDGTVEAVESISNDFPGLIELHRSDDNRYFVEPCNQLIARYPECDAVLLNNDIEILTREWLYALFLAAYSASDVGGSGGMLLDAAGRVLEAGASMQNTGDGIHFGRGLDPDDPRITRIRSVGYVSGAMMYMRRDAIAAYGSLDPRFQPMYFEDTEWHYRLHQNGLRTVYTPHARALHHEGGSGGHGKFFEVARRRFVDHFRDVDLSALTPP